jgi:osmotically-inducible protein OsmY
MILRRVGAAVVLASAFAVGTASCANTEVRRPTATHSENAAVMARVKAALFGVLSREPQVNTALIRVATYRGTVWLSGFVESPELVEKAVKAVEEVNGVRLVKNELRVKPRLDHLDFL